MKVWVDAQLSPAMARYLKDELGTDASALRDIGLRDAEDGEIFQAARSASADRDDEGLGLRVVARALRSAAASCLGTLREHVER